MHGFIVKPGIHSHPQQSIHTKTYIIIQMYESVRTPESEHVCIVHPKETWDWVRVQISSFYIILDSLTVV